MKPVEDILDLEMKKNYISRRRKDQYARQKYVTAASFIYDEDIGYDSSEASRGSIDSPILENVYYGDLESILKVEALFKNSNSLLSNFKMFNLV